MSSATIYEIIGYAGSALVVLSLMSRSILRLRVVGLCASILFLVYGVLIEAYPIAVTNVVIIGIQVYFVLDLIRTKEYFTVLGVRPDSAYLRYFCDFHTEEIRALNPDWSYQPTETQIAVFLLRDLVPAGLFVAIVEPNGDLVVTLDFVIPQYRDFKVGRFLYSPRSGVFDDPRYHRAWSKPGSVRHSKYLDRMGFRPEGDRWVLDLDRVREPTTS
jgi:hypothetical protein